MILKNNTFHVSKRTLKQAQGTAIGTRFTPSHSKILMADLEQDMLQDLGNKSLVCWKYIDGLF